MHSSTPNFQPVILGTEQNPHLINLGVNCSPDENKLFIKICKEFKDIFSWTYDELNTFDRKIIQHNIPMKHSAKPYQQNLRKMHPSLEPSIKKELEKLLKVKFIFLVRHMQWISNLVPARKKSGEIKLCVDF